jgi:hypothetical protein
MEPHFESKVQGTTEEEEAEIKAPSIGNAQA